jgi:hypothetical protein
VTGAAFSPVPHSHDLVVAIAIVCAFLLWAGMLTAMVLLAKREERE